MEIINPTMNTLPPDNSIPETTYSPFAWLYSMTLEKAARTIIGQDFEKINVVNVQHGNKRGDNKLSLFFPIFAEVELKDGRNRSITYLLKGEHYVFTTHETALKLQLFPRESHVYYDIIPKLEQLYKDAGKFVELAPKAYRFDHDTEEYYMLMEDLRLKNYKKSTPVGALDMKHMQHALEKLAEFHAASACYVEHYGNFSELLTVGIYTTSNEELLKEINVSSEFFPQLKKWKNGQQYYEKLAKSDEYLSSCLIALHKVNPGEFNVLNHGDCRSNNILFQYDEVGHIRNTRFVDFQVAKYGSPAIDLYFLILSSAANDIKLTQFDFFVHYYYEKLVENLKLLQYQRPLPKLKSLHVALLQHGLTAYLVATKELPLILTDTSLDEIEDETEFKRTIYTNHKYVQIMAEIMPWLDNRGLLDWK